MERKEKHLALILQNRIEVAVLLDYTCCCLSLFPVMLQLSSFFTIDQTLVSANYRGFYCCVRNPNMFTIVKRESVISIAAYPPSGKLRCTIVREIRYKRSGDTWIKIHVAGNERNGQIETWIDGIYIRESRIDVCVCVLLVAQRCITFRANGNGRWE